jgi:hypothetical protein
LIRAKTTDVVQAHRDAQTAQRKAASGFVPGKPRASGCATCGCQGHGQAWQVTCVRCGGEKWPMAVERPVGYVCRLCQAIAPETAASRKAAGQKATATKRQKARVESPDVRGGP